MPATVAAGRAGERRDRAFCRALTSAMPSVDRPGPTVAVVRKLVVLLPAAAVLIGGCGSSGSSKAPNPNAKEQSPPGDIPDNQVFVAYRPAGSGFVVKVPEGWARRTQGSSVVFASNLNSVVVQGQAAQRAPTLTDARRRLAPQLAKTTSGFRLLAVDVLRRPAGPALHLVYETRSPPNAVTGKRTVQTVERYIFYRNRREAVLALTGAKGADNVDPWRTVSSSLRWTR
jgi:hypothetical protein